jgi:hypothetical protein
VALDVEGTFFNLGIVSGFINPDMDDVVLTASQFVPTVKLNGHLRYDLSQDWVSPAGRVQIFMDVGAYWEVKEVRRSSDHEEDDILHVPAIVISPGEVICC